MVGTEGEWSNLVALHVRPAWWHGDCITMTCEEAEKALELAGADAGLATEVREFVEERVGQQLSGLGALVSEVRALVGEEAKEVFSRAGGGRAGGVRGAAGRDRRGDRGEACRAERGAGGGADHGRGPAVPELAPTTSYMDLAVPEAEQPAAPVAPQTTQDPSPVPPGGDGTVMAEEAPWESEEADDDEAVGRPRERRRRFRGRRFGRRARRLAAAVAACRGPRCRPRQAVCRRACSARR